MAVEPNDCTLRNIEVGAGAKHFGHRKAGGISGRNGQNAGTAGGYRIGCDPNLVDGRVRRCVTADVQIAAWAAAAGRSKVDVVEGTREKRNSRSRGGANRRFRSRKCAT